ncbi:MAG: hypothetical protein U1F67_07405 [Rubrivivax sp.]
MHGFGFCRRAGRAGVAVQGALALSLLGFNVGVGFRAARRRGAVPAAGVRAARHAPVPARDLRRLGGHRRGGNSVVRRARLRPSTDRLVFG